MKGFSNTFIEAYQTGDKTPKVKEDNPNAQYEDMFKFDFSNGYDRRKALKYLTQQAVMDIANDLNNGSKGTGVSRYMFNDDFKSTDYNIDNNNNIASVVSNMLTEGLINNKYKNELIESGVIDNNGFATDALAEKVKELYIKYAKEGGFYFSKANDFLLPKNDLENYLSENKKINFKGDTTLTIDREKGAITSNKNLRTVSDYVKEKGYVTDAYEKRKEASYVRDRDSWNDYVGSLGMYEDIARTASTVTAFTPASSLSGILDYGALGLRIADEWDDPRYTTSGKVANYLTDFGYATIGLVPYGKLVTKLIKGEKIANALAKTGKAIQWATGISGAGSAIMTVSGIVNHWNTEGITVDDARHLMYSLTALGSAGYANFSNVSRASKSLTKLDKELGYNVKSWDSEGFKNAAKRKYSGSELDNKLKQIDDNFASIDKWRNSKATKSWYNFNKSKEFGPTGRPLIKGNDDAWTTLVNIFEGFTRSLSKKPIVKPLTYSPPKEVKVTIPEGSRVNRLTKKVKDDKGNKVLENRSPVNRISNEKYLPLLHGWGNPYGGGISGHFTKNEIPKGNLSTEEEGGTPGIDFLEVSNNNDKAFIDSEYKKNRGLTLENGGNLYKGIKTVNSNGLTVVKYYKMNTDDNTLNSINTNTHYKLSTELNKGIIDERYFKKIVSKKEGGILEFENTNGIIAGQSGTPLDLYKFNSNINNGLDYSSGAFIKNDKGEFVFNSDYNKKQNGFNIDFNIDNNFNTIATDNNGNPISLDFYKQNANNGNPPFIRNNDGTFTLNPNYNQVKTGFSIDSDVKLDVGKKTKMAIPTEEYSKKPDPKEVTNPFSGKQLPYKKGTLTEDLGLYAGSYLLGEVITGSGNKEKDAIETAHNRYLNGDYDVIRKPLVYSPKFIRTASGLSHEYKTTALNNIMQNIKSNKTSDIRLNMVSDKMNQLQMNQAESNLNAKDYEGFKQDQLREETEYANESAKENAIVNQNIQMENAANVTDKQMKSKSDMMYDQAMLDFYINRKAETQSFMKGMRDIIYYNNHDYVKNNYNDNVNNYNGNIAIEEEKFNNLSEPLKQEYYKLYTELTDKNNNLTKEEITIKTNRINEIIR